MAVFRPDFCIFGQKNFRQEENFPTAQNLGGLCPPTTTRITPRRHRSHGTSQRLSKWPHGYRRQVNSTVGNTAATADILQTNALDWWLCPARSMSDAVSTREQTPGGIPSQGIQTIRALFRSSVAACEIGRSRKSTVESLLVRIWLGSLHARRQWVLTLSAVLASLLCTSSHLLAARVPVLPSQCINRPTIVCSRPRRLPQRVPDTTDTLRTDNKSQTWA